MPEAVVRARSINARSLDIGPATLAYPLDFGDEGPRLPGRGMRSLTTLIVTVALAYGIALTGALNATAASGPKFIGTPKCVITQPDAFSNEITCSARIVGAKDGVAWVDGLPEFRCNSDPATVAFTGTGGSPLTSVTNGRAFTTHSQARYPSSSRPDVPFCAGEAWTFIAFRQTAIMVLFNGVIYTSPVGDVYPAS
jgi:hypothetical protein